MMRDNKLQTRDERASNTRFLSLICLPFACALMMQSAHAQKTSSTIKGDAQPTTLVANANPTQLLRDARVIYVSTATSLFEPVQLQNELRKDRDFTAWQMLIVDGYRWSEPKTHDIEIEVDHITYTFDYTFKITDAATDIVLATGKVIAWNSKDAAPLLARRIIKELKSARASAPSTSDKR